MAYTVVRSFIDRQDNKHLYKVGDSFPRLNYEVSEERILSLMNGDNKAGKVFIQSDEPVKEPEKPRITKSKIVTMKASDLRKLASDNGLKNAEEYTGTELKKWLIDTLGL